MAWPTGEAKTVCSIPELSVTLMIKIVASWLNICYSARICQVKVFEEPGCPKVERITLFKDRKLCRAVETLRVVV